MAIGLYCPQDREANHARTRHSCMIVWDGANPVTAAKHFHRWLADAKRVAFEPLYARERAKVKHHLPGTTCEPLTVRLG